MYVGQFKEKWMEKVWELYENMKEIVYVTDMDSYEVVYINRYGLKKTGFTSLNEVVGKPCYKIIQKGSFPCINCNNDKLKVGEFYEWKYENSILGQAYLIKETVVPLENRRYHLMMVIDIGFEEHQDMTARQYRTYEAVVNEALRTALAAPTPDKSLDVLLEHMGKSLKSERVYVFEETESHDFNNTYEWCAEGVSPQKENLQELSMEIIGPWYESFKRNENVIIKDVEHLKNTNPKAYDCLIPQKIQSLVVSPLIFRGKIVGFYGVDNPPQDMLDHISIMFMVLGHFIASILRRRDLVRKLEKLSYYDQLTGALNRHGMNEFIANVDHDASIGLVYVDVTGLKQVNDTKGHLEGDKLLIHSYQCLIDHFDKNTVFRIGGDEFLVMGNNVDKEDLEKRVQKMAQSMEQYGVHLAFGCVWEEKCNGRILELFKEADRRMYENKKEYYAMHPEKIRKS